MMLSQGIKDRVVICQRLLGEKDLPVPRRSKKGDAGFDLYCAEEKTLAPDEEAWICQGIRVKVPYGSVGMVFPRSSANKVGLHVKIGTIDAGYTGRMYAGVVNHAKVPVTIKRGDRICQLVPLALFPLMDESMMEVEEMPNTERGDSGFGSTGGEVKASAPKQ